MSCLSAKLLKCWIAWVLNYLSYLSAQLLECWVAWVLGCLSAGLLECYVAWVLSCLSAGLLECWVAWVLSCLSAELLECWIAWVLSCWVVHSLNTDMFACWQASYVKKRKTNSKNCLKTFLSHIDSTQIKKSSWLGNKMCREWPNLSFKQLKLDLKIENWLKAKKNRNLGGRAATTFESLNLKIENFSWRQFALSWRSARNPSLWY